jgi:hypothetical protein
VNMAPPAIIDLYPCEMDLDGARVYRPPLQALGLGMSTLVLRYPHEIAHGVALCGIVGACVWLAYDAPKPPRRRKRSKV